MNAAYKSQVIYEFFSIAIIGALAYFFPSKGWAYLMVYFIITSAFIFQKLSRRETILLVFSTPIIIVMINLIFDGTPF